MQTNKLSELRSPPAAAKSSRLLAGTPKTVVRIRTLAEWDEHFRQAWMELEQNSVSRSPFASADFVLSAADHLPRLAPPLALCIEHGGTLVGLGIFEDVAHSRRLPVRHLRSWQTPHTYFDGLLLREGCTHRALTAFWNYLTSAGHDWHGVEFPRCSDGEAADRMLDDSAGESQVMCLRGVSWQRASLHPQEATASDLLGSISTKRAKSLRRGWRELEKHGPVRFEIRQDSEAMELNSKELMRLEGLGWKSDIGTSLASQESQSRFFRDFVARSNARGNVFFCRMMLGDEAVASLVNFRAGDAVYSFKLGWDPRFERGCPGFQLMMQTAARIATEVPGVRLVDSCASSGSFIEHLWPHRRRFASRTYATSPVGTVTATMVNGLRWVRKNARYVSRQLFGAPLEPES